MREICFRAKRIPDEEWVEGFFVDDGMYEVEHYFIGSFVIEPTRYDPWDVTGMNGLYEVDPETLCQYTGLQDKKGTRIFEHDILKIRRDDEYPEKTAFAEIAWDGCGYALRKSDFWEEADPSDAGFWEVVGNIFDNPELVKENDAAGHEIRKQRNDKGWIPVEERLPEKEECVLICNSFGLIYIGWYSGDSWKKEFPSLSVVTNAVAWRPLPEPYRPKKPGWRENFRSRFERVD